MSKWEKVRSDKESMELRAGGLRICVHRYIHAGPDEWFVSARIAMPDQEPLKPTDLAQAQCQAKAKVQVILEEALRELLASSTGEGGE